LNLLRDLPQPVSNSFAPRPKLENSNGNNTGEGFNKKVQFTFKDANDQLKLGKDEMNSDTSNSSDEEDGKPSRIVNKKKDFLSPKFAGS
jgi:hypothetical protein